MEHVHKRLFAICLMLACCLLSVTAQSQCTLTGWASQNGGVTGGGSATPTVVSNYTDFKNAMLNTAVKVIHVSGTITFPAAGRISFQDQSGKTIYGLPGSKLVSSDITASGSGILNVKRCSNIIFRNLTFEGPGAYDTDGWDNMVLDQSTNVWVDHCDFQDGVDGNLDVKNQADYISITWCRFVYFKPPIAGGSGGADDHRFSNLFGSSDGATSDRGKLRITLQNCWWAQGCKERMPRVRFGKIHIVNNYFSCSGNNHCVRAGFEADIRVESNYFENVNKPIDLFENDFTAVTVVNNSFVNTTGNTAGSGTAFTPPYTLSVTPAANVKSQVMAGAGATLSSPTCGGGGTTTYTVTTTASPTAGGSVSGGGSYTSGSTATLTATAAAGYTFTGWSGGASGTTNPLNVTVNSNLSVTANFTASTTTYTLTTTASPAAGGSVSGGGSYASGATATVTATPAAGYTFSGWSGAATGTTNPTTITMNANKSVTATFTATGGGGTSTIRIEDDATAATGFCSYEGSISSNSGANNSKVVNLTNSSAKGVNWKVNTPSAGSYTLTWRYVNSSSSNTYVMRLIVNGVTITSSQAFPQTSSSTTFSTSTATVSLVAGGNTIRLESVASSATADIDWIEITGNSPTAGNCGAARTALPNTPIVGSELEKASVYPNPAKGTANVAFRLAEADKVSIQIMDATGKVVSTQTSSLQAGNHVKTLTIPGKAAGLYSVIIYSEKRKKEVLKLIVE